MTTLCKQTLLEIIEESQCHDDLVPLISLLPFSSLKTTLYDYVQNELTENDQVRKEYYNRVNIEHLLPEALISSILTYLPFKETSRCCRVSLTFNQSSLVALYHTKILLSIGSYEEYYDYNIQKRKQDIIQYLPESQLPTFEIKFVKFENFLHNKYIKTFIHKYWNRIIHLNITNSSTDINKLLHAFDVKITDNLQSMINFYPLKDYDDENVLQLQYYNFKYLEIGLTKGLQFICLPFQGQKTWNIITEYCPNLHGIMLNIGLDGFNKASELIITAKDGFNKAPNLWTLTIDSECDDEVIGFDCDFLNKILKSCPNLYHLSIGFSIIIENDQYLKLPTKNLISLTFNHDGDVEFPNNYNLISKCRQLKYLDIPWMIQLNDNIDEEIDGLYKLIATFINNKGIFIGITSDTSDRFDESVNDILTDEEDDDDYEEDQALDRIFNRLREILMDRYHCHINNNELIILMDDELDEDEQRYAKKLGIITFGCSEIKCKKISQEEVIKVVVQHVLDENNEFRLFIEKIWNGSIIDHLTNEGVFL